MSYALLATKVQLPRRPTYLVHRVRLVERLERNTPYARLILVSAPAGYGKTTLLAEWAQTSGFGVAWLSLGEEESDPDRFLRYLLSAWEELRPGISRSRLGLLLGAQAPDRGAVLSAFINAAAGIAEPSVFVLDDYHRITDAAVHQAVTFLLDHLPPTVHIVIASREEPPLPLARYRARGELLELDAVDLQFQEEETRDLLARLTGRDLPRDEVVTLHSRLEGWVAGLQLAALALKRRGELADWLLQGGRNRFIADYLHQEVLAQLTGDVRQFLVQTSVLGRLCGSVCDAVTGRDDGQEMLERLDREHLFLVPLDDCREWYRYHTLFADVLRAELARGSPHDLAHLHRRAAGWYLSHDLPEEAFPHAVASGDRELVSEIFERSVFVKLHSGELRTVQDWLDALPSSWRAVHPVFGLAHAALMAFSGALDVCVRCIDAIEQHLTSTVTDDAARHLARVTAMRCFMACFDNDLEQAEALASLALRDLPADDLTFRADVYHALGDTYRRNGRWQDARAAYLAVLGYADAPTFGPLSVHVYGALADLALRRGQLRVAAEYWQQALTAIEARENAGRFPLSVIGWVHIRLAELLYERADLAEAERRLACGLECAEVAGDVRATCAGYLIAGRLQLTHGNTETAAGFIERARPLVEHGTMPEWTGRFDRLQVEFWIAQHQCDAVRHWIERVRQAEHAQARAMTEDTQLAVARGLISLGEASSCALATTVLDGCRRAADVEGRTGIQIEALALQALAAWQGGDRPSALTHLDRALRLAAPEGYVRLFADLGLPMARLLQEARSRNVMPDYVRVLLAACDPAIIPHTTTRVPLPEPLTTREHAVLNLLAAGLKNDEIAELLSISPETVKKHTSNIYGKLGVGGRTAAAARARQLNLLR